MQDHPLFAALLTPHRSLDTRGIRIVVAVYAILASVPGIYFFATGAWPVVGFLGLDILALWWALSASRKTGDAFEEVTLWADSLEVRHVSHKGKAHNHAFNPFWVRLHVERDHDDRVTKLALRMRDEELEIGAFLNPDDKASFAAVFGQALHKARA
ncbi:DUF2244 domain-containing protein [Mariluticola halotolerans]|uniref:DUF2244 domain-containing protein n=1 Tax=Mariluticola halotolerans TaxID=2909283 RepID=UPI0026E28FF0|nr:DUF2244 domain-containing protein [Mariluticola halotolerans]UJQ93481.1 DUF2244 domain-containing protein [Mariluticola halotolerans]